MMMHDLKTTRVLTEKQWTKDVLMIGQVQSQSPISSLALPYLNRRTSSTVGLAPMQELLGASVSGDLLPG